MKNGGPERKAFGNDKVIPANFSEKDKFWDLGPKLNEIEEGVRKGKIEDLLIIHRTEGEIWMYWRGKSSMTTGLGMLAWTEKQLLEP